VIEPVTTPAEEGEVVAAVNFNSPGQVVIAGNSRRGARHGAGQGRRRQARAAAAGERAVPLQPDEAGRRGLRRLLARIDLRAPEIPVLHNVDVQAPAIRCHRAALVRQLYQPGALGGDVQAMHRQGIQAMLVECGPGKVLAGLNKRIEQDL
jgi:[acyl-carrier-protein] S-malonyltransferase